MTPSVVAVSLYEVNLVLRGLKAADRHAPDKPSVQHGEIVVSRLQDRFGPSRIRAMSLSIRTCAFTVPTRVMWTVAVSTNSCVSDQRGGVLPGDGLVLVRRPVVPEWLH